jgi:hypothetical protein
MVVMPIGYRICVQQDVNDDIDCTFVFIVCDSHFLERVVPRLGLPLGRQRLPSQFANREFVNFAAHKQFVREPSLMINIWSWVGYESHPSKQDIE